MREWKKRLSAGRSLSHILWFVFALFALVLLLVFLAVQSLLVGQQYRAQTVAAVREAGADMEAALEHSGGGAISVWHQLRDIESEYDVDIHFLAPDGSVLYSDISEDESYREVARALEERLSAGESDVLLNYDNAVFYASVVILEGRTSYLCVSGSLARIHTLETSLWIISLVTALFSVVLAFVASGFVAAIITRPVTEVTDRAKELARGHYDLDFKRDYYCMEIAELSDALDHAREEISKADAVQKELIANVSHDFKTPLTMIKAYASMIREISGDDKEKRDTHAQIIIDEADRLAALVGDVLDISRIRAGVGAHAPAVFNLSELLYKIGARFDYLHETQGYVFEAEIEEDIYAFADRERIEQVVYNLIGNAVNYTGEDKRVGVRLARTNEGARLEITDTGKGIPPEQLDSIWDRYYRLKETHKRPVKGTGLGLSIVKNILVMQNCPFGVESEVGKGSCFWVEFPSPPEDTELHTAEPVRRKGHKEDKV